MTLSDTVVIGIDGAHFELLHPWIAQGKLPNIERLFDSGVTADLESVLPPVTSPNWKAYATGKNPGQFGIFWWENIDIENQRVFYPSERKRTHKEYWEYLSESHNAGVLGVPTTYPPKQTVECYVSGAPDGQNSGYAHPPGLEKELQRKFEYRITKRTRLKDNLDEAAEEILELINMRFEAAKYLYEKYDLNFLQVSTFYINSLQHYLWDHESTLEAWQLIDEHVGWFLEEDLNVVMMSDHGSTPIETVFYINSWLEKEGYLSLSNDLSKTLHKLGITTDRLIQITNRLGIRDVVQSLAPSLVVNKIPEDDGTIARERKTDNINWKTTVALASGQGPIYVASGPEIDNRKALIDRLARDITDLTDETGRPVIQNVMAGSDIYSGFYEDEIPDLILDQRDGTHISGDIGKDTIFVSPDEEGWRAENKRHGLFAAAGPAFAQFEVPTLSILDLAPTLLHLFRAAVPDDMEGTVRTDVFAADAEPHERAVERRHVALKQNEIDRIRDSVAAVTDTRDL